MIGSTCGHNSACVPCGNPVRSAGQKIACGEGYSVCTGGSWSQCHVEHVTYVPAPGTGKSTQTFGDASQCANACDPYCLDFASDTPEGLDNADAGLSVTDAGLTIVLTDQWAETDLRLDYLT